MCLYQHYCSAVVSFTFFFLLPILLRKIRRDSQGANKVIFTACHLGKQKLVFTSPNLI